MLSHEQIPRDSSGLVEGRWGILLSEPLNHGAGGVWFHEGQADEVDPRPLVRMVATFSGAVIAIARRTDDLRLEVVPPLDEVADQIEAALKDRTPTGLWDVVLFAIDLRRRAAVIEAEERAKAEGPEADAKIERDGAEADPKLDPATGLGDPSTWIGAEAAADQPTAPAPEVPSILAEPTTEAPAAAEAPTDAPAPPTNKADSKSRKRSR